MATRYDEAVDYLENTTMTLAQISKELDLPLEGLRQWFCTTYDECYRAERKRINYRNSKLGNKNPMYGKFGEEHHNFKGVCSDNKGYIICLKPDWFTGRKGSKHIFKHHEQYCLFNGITEIPEGCVVHHKDGDPLNNHPNNLELLTKSEHAKLHHKINLQNTSTGDEDD